MNNQIEAEAESKFLALLKWSKIVAKFVAAGTAIAGVIAAVTSSSTTTGFAVGAAGATSYAAAKSIPTHGYEKTKHVSPRNVKSASAASAIMAHQPVKLTKKEADKAVLKEKNKPQIQAKDVLPAVKSGLSAVPVRNIAPSTESVQRKPVLVVENNDDGDLPYQMKRNAN